MTDALQISMLPNLLPLAGILLAFSVAYLKLEPFQLSLRITEYAEKCLGQFDQTVILSYFVGTRDYRNLVFLADSVRHKDLPDSGIIYRIVFKSGLDRWIAGISSIIALFVLVLGSLHSINRPFLAQFFGDKQIFWLWLLLAICLLISMILGIVNETIVNNMKGLMNENVATLLEIKKGVEIRDLGFNPAGADSPFA